MYLQGGINHDVVGWWVEVVREVRSYAWWRAAHAHLLIYEGKGRRSCYKLDWLAHGLCSGGGNAISPRDRQCFTREIDRVRTNENSARAENLASDNAVGGLNEQTKQG